VKTVLVVSGEAGVRISIRHALMLERYAVLAAENASQALEISNSHRERSLHLLIADAGLPDLSAFELAEAIVANRSDTRVLIAGKHADQRLAGAGYSFLKKPIIVPELVRIVNLILKD